MNCKTPDLSLPVYNQNILTVATVCVCVSSLPGFGGEVLTEVFHNVEGINSRSRKNASCCLETQIYKKRKKEEVGGWVNWTKAERRQGNTQEGTEKEKHTERGKVSAK